MVDKGMSNVNRMEAVAQTQALPSTCFLPNELKLDVSSTEFNAL